MPHHTAHVERGAFVTVCVVGHYAAVTFAGCVDFGRLVERGYYGLRLIAPRSHGRVGCVLFDSAVTFCRFERLLRLRYALHTLRLDLHTLPITQLDYSWIAFG